ncbi:CDP-diacylglycerol--inositol 3-phosphatidyltransferase-like [Symsagittifera roscoffensis]|uniref:CDP-diacylglycerol--inositol 3-phosphatidyltransferase-like n=1 Tax=Symsagittifera roscoffensis TaxID=84072 RepID=UPI00307C4722
MACTAATVLLFVPNLIGYIRILLLVISCCTMLHNHYITVCCYLLSQLLDALDGHAARALGQSSKFGALLDMLTDRASTACIMMGLCVLYPKYTVVFQMSMALDIVSHWMHLHVSTISGNASHKAISLEGNPILKLYYTSKPVLFFMCAGNELFYSMLYLMAFTQGPMLSGVNMSLFRFIFYLSCPVWFAKSSISLLHLVVASVNVAKIDASDRSKES